MTDYGIASATENNEEYTRAFDLHCRIITSANMVQNSLYELAKGFVEMRDSKLYKQLGYNTFEDYCKAETGLERRQVYNYIDIIENLPPDFVHSNAQKLGVTKLVLLAKLTDTDREDIVENGDVENASVRELEEQIKQLKKEKALLGDEFAALEGSRKSDSEKIIQLEENKRKLSDRISALEELVRELESQPVVVAEQQLLIDTYEFRQAVERENKKALAAAEEAKANEVAELNAKLEAARIDYEKKLSDAKETSAQSEERKNVFKAYFTTAYDALNRLVEFVKNENELLFFEKTNGLISAIGSELER